MPALGVLEKRFGFSCTSFLRFVTDEGVFVTMYGGRVCCIFTILLRNSILEPPLEAVPEQLAEAAGNLEHAL